MTKPTQGPWFCRPSSKSDAEYVIFNEDENYLTTDDAEHEANARLIAAAPALLAALIELDQYMIAEGVAYPQGTFDVVHGAIAAAIAAAKGEG